MSPNYTRQQFVRVCACGCGQPTLIAPANDWNGQHKGQPRTYLLNHHGKGKPSHNAVTDHVAHFMTKVDKDGPLMPGMTTRCWSWQGSLSIGGYGEFFVKGRGMMRAHRFIYDATHDAPLGDAYGCHRCDNPGCVNPGHIFPGTQTDNMRDMIKKGRRLSHGEHNSRAILTVEQVMFIKANPQLPNTTLARRFGVAPATISKVKNGTNWKHLP